MPRRKRSLERRLDDLEDDGGTTASEEWRAFLQGEPSVFRRRLAQLQDEATDDTDPANRDPQIQETKLHEY